MATQMATAQVERILVAVDASPHSIAALQAAAEVAALLDAELEGLFVEDINLLYVCGLPFGREVGSYTATVRRLDSQAMERQLRVLAAVIREKMARAADRSHTRWSFQVRRGPVVTELLAASEGAAMLSLGRAGRRERKALGSTAQSVLGKASRPVLILGERGGLQYPLTVVYTGSVASERALALGVSLARRSHTLLRVWVWAGEGEKPERLHTRLEATLARESVRARIETVFSATPMLAVLQAGDGGTLILPGERASLLGEHAGAAILVP